MLSNSQNIIIINGKTVQKLFYVFDKGQMCTNFKILHINNIARYIRFASNGAPAFMVCSCPKGSERCLGKLAQERGIRIDRDCPSDCLRLPKYGLTPLCASGCKLFADEL